MFSSVMSSFELSKLTSELSLDLCCALNSLKSLGMESDLKDVSSFLMGSKINSLSKLTKTPLTWPSIFNLEFIPRG